MKKNQRIGSIEKERGRVYRLLADAFRITAPDVASFLPDLKEALARIDSAASAEVIRWEKNSETSSDRLSLEVDYTRLFVGPFLAPAPPFGSVYLEPERRLMGNSTMDVQQHYRGRGFDIADHFKEPPDHIAAELEFMYILCSQSYAAIESGSREAYADSLQEQYLFLNKHLSAWVPSFSEKVIEHAQTDYYRYLAGVVREFIAEESKVLTDFVIETEPEPVR